MPPFVVAVALVPVVEAPVLDLLDPQPAARASAEQAIRTPTALFIDDPFSMGLTAQRSRGRGGHAEQVHLDWSVRCRHATSSQGPSSARQSWTPCWTERSS